MAAQVIDFDPHPYINQLNQLDQYSVKAVNRSLPKTTAEKVSTAAKKALALLVSPVKGILRNVSFLVIEAIYLTAQIILFPVSILSTKLSDLVDSAKLTTLVSLRFISVENVCANSGLIDMRKKQSSSVAKRLLVSGERVGYSLMTVVAFALSMPIAPFKAILDEIKGIT